MFTEDLSVFLNADEFAYNATLDGVGITGILNLGGIVEEADTVTVAPTFLVPTASAAGAVGKTLVCNGISYKVRSAPLDPESRDGAFTLLVLARVTAP